MSRNELIKNEEIESGIHTIRSVQVILDSILAELYRVETKTLNRAVKRNIDRFPDEFMFQLTNGEWTNLKYKFGTPSFVHGGRRTLPFVFTEQGVAMLSAVLRSEIAIIKSQAGLNSYKISVKDWSAKTNAIGLGNWAGEMNIVKIGNLMEVLQ